jgi:hypothetical protein
MLRSFAQGLSILKSPRHFSAVFGWTLLNWTLQPVAFWLGFKAVGIDVPWSAALLVQGAIVVGVSVPSTPGFFGLFEIAAAAALPLYGVTKTAATTWAILFHVASFIPITIIGAYYFARLGLKMSDIGSAAQGKPRRQRSTCCCACSGAKRVDSTRSKRSSSESISPTTCTFASPRVVRSIAPGPRCPPEDSAR